MTNKKDSFKQRKEAELSGIEETRGIPQDGFADPNGEFPKRDYFYGPGISKTSRGEQINTLYFTGGDYGVDVSVAEQIPSSYPLNQVQETPSGHVIEIDDTPGGEKILLKHKSGSGVEFRADGSLVFSSKNKKVSMTGGDDVVIVEGQATLVYKGNLNIRVDGDFNVDVDGNYNLNVAGDKTENIKGRHNKTVDRDQNYTVRGVVGQQIGQDYVQTVGKRSTVSIGGDSRLFIDGNLDMGVSKRLQMTSQEKLIFASQKTQMTSELLTINALKGTIGGDDVEHYGNIFKGTASSDWGASDAVFFGRLIGSAQQADNAKHAIQADNATLAQGALVTGSSSVVTVDNVSSPKVVVAPAALPKAPLPNLAYPSPVGLSSPEAYPPVGLIVDLMLSARSTGVFEVQFPKKFQELIRLVDDYKGAFINKPTIHEVRSKLRDPQWRDNGELTSKLVGEARLSKSWAENSPPKIGRTANKNGTIRFGEELIGNNPADNRSKRFVLK